MFIVYKHICPNDKIYIGITSQAAPKRWRNGEGYKQNKHFYSAILKYGWDNIKHEILFENLSKKQACEIEKRLIAEYDSTNRKKRIQHFNWRRGINRRNETHRTGKEKNRRSKQE